MAANVLLPVHIAPSPIHGLGVFASQIIPPNTLVGQYQGELINRRKFWRRYPRGWGRYVVALPDPWDGMFMDARDQPSHDNIGRYVNDARNTEWDNNCRFAMDAGGKSMFIETLREISEGEELLVDYGDDYWLGERRNDRATISRN